MCVDSVCVCVSMCSCVCVCLHDRELGRAHIYLGMRVYEPLSEHLSSCYACWSCSHKITLTKEKSQYVPNT